MKEKKKWGLGRVRNGETHSFIPLCREPSTIEKILGDAEKEQQRAHILHSKENPKLHSLPNREQQQSLPLPPVLHQHKRAFHHVAPTPNYHQIAATKIQTAYRGYMARRSYRALKGLVRLQGVVRGQSVKRQTMNAMKFMQLHVRVNQQIHTRRIQMMENQAVHRQNLHKIDKELEGSLGKGTFTQPSEADQHEWDDSMLTKEEIDARLQRKVEAFVKRERAMAYAYSHQLWKGAPKLAHTALMEIRSGGFPWWWNWLERQPQAFVQEGPAAHVKNDTIPPKPTVEPHSSNHRKPKFGNESIDIVTPRSTKPVAQAKAKNVPTPAASRLSKMDSVTSQMQMKAKAVDEFSLGATPRDDDSLTSCPQFSVPNYMAPTVSAKAKVRAHSTPKERSAAATPKHTSKRRLSFPLAQGIGSLKWNKGSLFSGKDSTSQRILGNHKSFHSIENLSIDSTLSLPAGVGRKPFK